MWDLVCILNILYLGILSSWDSSIPCRSSTFIVEKWCSWQKKKWFQKQVFKIQTIYLKPKTIWVIFNNYQTNSPYYPFNNKIVVSRLIWQVMHLILSFLFYFCNINSSPEISSFKFMNVFRKRFFYQNPSQMWKYT